MKYITEGLRQILSQPLGKLSQEIPADRRVWACVGDYSAMLLIKKGIEPKIVVFDLKTKRQEVSQEEKDFFNGLDRELLECVNPPGTITESLEEAVDKASKSKKPVKLFVDGEEDLAVLPLVEKAPFNALVVYGQPDQGMVIVECSARAKSNVKELLAKFEEEE